MHNDWRSRLRRQEPLRRENACGHEGCARLPHRGQDQVVDELILSFTHDVEIDFMLPGIPPTGKHVELAHVVVMKFEGDRIAHEHIYWDQASLLAQVGLLDPSRLPVADLEQARTLLEKSRRQTRA